MFVGFAKVELFIGYSHSLKEKRRVLKKIIDNVKNRLPVSVAEVDHQDLWQKAAIGFSIVSSDAVQAERVIEKTLDLIHDLSVCEITNTKKEIFPW